MPSDQDRIKSFLNNLAGAVIAAIRTGSPDDRKRLIATLRDMDAQMPGISEDTAGAKEFLSALVSLLEGNPMSAEGLAEPYAGIYAAIIKETLSTGKPEKPGGDKDMKEFLTQLAATVIMVMKTGTEDDQKALAGKLRETHKSIPDKDAAGILILALVSILEGNPFDAQALPIPYSHFYQKVVDSIGSGSR